MIIEVLCFISGFVVAQCLDDVFPEVLSEETKVVDAVKADVESKSTSLPAANTAASETTSTATPSQPTTPDSHSS